MKKNKLLSILAIGVLCLSGCGTSFESSINVTTSIHTEAQSQFLTDSLDNFVKYASGTKELSYPEPIKITIDEKFYEPDRYKVEISEIGSSDVTTTYNFTDGTASVYNLKLGTTYQYKIVDSNGENTTEGQFTTDDIAPRNLMVYGVTNVRDLGGYATSSGKKIKQGMIIRSARFNKDKAEDITIEASGIEVLCKDFNIKTEIDFRQEEVRTTSALGPSVNYINIPMSGTMVYNDFTQLNNEIYETFKVLSDKNNYPVVIHCSVGTDRTGMISFLVNGLCGVSENDLYRDYMFSNFGQIKGMRKLSEITDSYVKYIKALPGDTLSAKIREYLLSIGMTDSELDEIIKIMTE